MTSAPIPEARTVLVVGDADAPSDTASTVLAQRGYADRLADAAAAQAELRAGRYKLTYLDYDWALNDAR